MKTLRYIIVLVLFLSVGGCKKKTKTVGESSTEKVTFPPELVNLEPYKGNPIFDGTGEATWDKNIRERGYILKEDSIYKMWYSGFNTDSTEEIHLGYATSKDGIHWDRYPGNPIYKDYWVEDMCVVKYQGSYYMFAEGVGDIAHLMVSEDGINWERAGNLDIRKVNGEPISDGPYGTPTIWIENEIWYLFYERDDAAIWLATSTDHKVWTNVQDEPVIKTGPADYDKIAVATNQIIKYKGKYYTYYHATANDPWKDWSSNIAMSEDLIHWTKYDKNPIVSPDHSSPIVVFDGEQYRLYTMFPPVNVYFPKR